MNELKIGNSRNLMFSQPIPVSDRPKGAFLEPSHTRIHKELGVALFFLIKKHPNMVSVGKEEEEVDLIMLLL